jgi:cytochrome P450
MMRATTGLRTAGVADTARILGGALGPILLQGVIARRPRAVAVADRLDLDGRAVALLQRMRDRYGTGPLRLRIPGRSVALLLDPDDVARVLAASPEPFAADSREKRGALGHFQPHGVLVSHGAVRAERRRFVESVLDTGRPVHRLGAAIGGAAREEARRLADEVGRAGALDWAAFSAAWNPLVRRVVLGDGARADEETTALLTALRGQANWSYLAPGRPDRQQRLRARLAAHVARADPGSLAALVATVPAPDRVDPLDQLPHWLFAYDPAGIATFRALALLLTHPDAPRDPDGLRAAVLESVRLWPTTAVVLRDTTEETAWAGGSLPAGTSLGIVSSFFHRDGATVPAADRFTPGQWRDGTADDGRTLLPFSAGPVVCPGRELVLFTAAEFLDELLSRTHLLPTRPLREPLPRGLNPFSLRFTRLNPE